LSCWQNRRARIYLDGITLDQFPETLDVSAFAKHIVLSGKNLIPLPLDDVNARPSLFFHHGEATENVLELQVWHLENGRRCLFEEFGPRHDNDPSMRLERIATAKNRFYITLDCEKRLKVQRLVLVAVLRIDGKLYVSDDAHFPPPSSKRGASPRIKGRTGPYEMLLSFTDHSGDEDRGSPRNGGTTASPPVSGRRRASSLKSTSSAATSPRSGSSAEVTSWQTLGKWLLETRHTHLPGALILQHLAQLSSIAIDFGSFAISNGANGNAGATASAAMAGSGSAQQALPTVESIREELLLWLRSGPYHIMELLEAGILDQCIQEPWFLGNISDAGAQAYLHWYRQRANLRSAFLVRFSSPHSSFAHSSNLPHLVLDATWTNDASGVPVVERYSATVLYEFDQFGQLYFWIDTSNDAGPSRSHSLAEVVRYIYNTTGWPHVWRNSPSGVPFSSASTHSQNLLSHHHASSINSPYQIQSGYQQLYGNGPQPLSTHPADAISGAKHRSMPLLHSSPSHRLHSSAGVLANGNLMSPVSPHGSPAMLVIPSKIGILPHDPATSHNHMALDVSPMIKVEDSCPSPTAWAASSYHSPNTPTASKNHRLDQMDTGSSESTNSFELRSPNGSGHHDTDAGSSSAPMMDQTDSSVSDLAHQTHDLDFPSHLHHPHHHSLHPSQPNHQGSGLGFPMTSHLTSGGNHEPYPVLSSMSSYESFSDSIGGVRSLSAPTALRWSGTSNLHRATHNNTQSTDWNAAASQGNTAKLHASQTAQPPIQQQHQSAASQQYPAFQLGPADSPSPAPYFMSGQSSAQSQTGFYFTPSQSHPSSGNVHDLGPSGAFGFQSPSDGSDLSSFRFTPTLDFNSRSSISMGQPNSFSMNGAAP
jgi:hypothetical protein